MPKKNGKQEVSTTGTTGKKLKKLMKTPERFWMPSSVQFSYVLMSWTTMAAIPATAPAIRRTMNNARMSTPSGHGLPSAKS